MSNPPPLMGFLLAPFHYYYKKLDTITELLSNTQFFQRIF